MQYKTSIGRELRHIEKRFQIALVILALAAIATMFILGAFDMAVTTALVALLLAHGAGLRANRRLAGKAVAQDESLHIENYRQLEALSSLNSCLRPLAPLPAMRGWAISPDFAGLIVYQCRLRNPATAVELGSGVSTVVLAYLARQGHVDRIISIEHDDTFLQETRRNLQAHDLEEFVDLRHAPLETVRTGHSNQPWYSAATVSDIDAIDLLIVDGPPSLDAHPYPRLPTLPALIDRLTPDATILLDDGARDDIHNCVKSWQSWYPQVTATYVDLEKGAYVLGTSA